MLEIGVLARPVTNAAHFGRRSTPQVNVTVGALQFLDAMVARSRNAGTLRLGLHLVLRPDACYCCHPPPNAWYS